MTDRDRRALRLGLAAVVGAALLFRGVPLAVRSWREVRSSIEQRRLLVERSRAQLAGMPQLDSASARIRERFVALAPRLVPGGTDAEASAALGALVAALGDRARVRIKQVETETDSVRAGALRRVSVRLEVEGDWSGATELFRSVAEERTSLLVGEVTVQASDPLSTPDRPEVLVLQTVLRGWYLPEEGR